MMSRWLRYLAGKFKLVVVDNFFSLELQVPGAGSQSMFLIGPPRTSAPPSRGQRVATATSDLGQPSTATSSGGWRRSSRATNTWRRSGGRGCRRSWDWGRTRSRSGSRTRGRNWRKLRSLQQSHCCKANGSWFSYLLFLYDMKQQLHFISYLSPENENG